MIPAQYKRIEVTRGGKYVFIEEDGLKGAVDKDNQIVLPFIFSAYNVSIPASYVYGSFDVYDEYFSITTYKNNSTYRNSFARFIEKPILNGNAFVNNEQVEFDNPPMIVQDRTIVPVRAVFEKMGFKVDWDDETQTAIIEGNNIRLEITQDKNAFLENGEYRYTDVAPINYESRIYLPLRAIAEAIGCNVDYDDATGNVSIDY